VELEGPQLALRGAGGASGSGDGAPGPLQAQDVQEGHWPPALDLPRQGQGAPAEGAEGTAALNGGHPTCATASESAGKGKKSDRRRRSRGSTVKEDRRFGIYDERRYVPIYSNPGASENGAGSGDDLQQLRGNGSAKRRRGEVGNPVDAEDAAAAEEQGGSQARGPPPKTEKYVAQYPLKKNGFKKPEAEGEGLGNGAMAGAERWDVKALPPKKAAAALHRQMRRESEEGGT